MITHHTPGPWHYSPDVSLHNTALVYGADKYLVADAGRIHRRQPEEQIANAKLIAAAPDLLDALRDMTEFYAQVTASPDEDSVLAAARAAIAKAEGRS